MLLELLSVGSCVDDETLITYPLYELGGYDSDGGIPLPECSSNWMDGLKGDDKIIVIHLLSLYKKNKKIKV